MTSQAGPPPPRGPPGAPRGGVGDPPGTPKAQGGRGAPWLSSTPGLDPIHDVWDPVPARPVTSWDPVEWGLVPKTATRCHITLRSYYYWLVRRTYSQYKAMWGVQFEPHPAHGTFISITSHPCVSTGIDRARPGRKIREKRRENALLVTSNIAHLVTKSTGNKTAPK